MKLYTLAIPVALLLAQDTCTRPPQRITCYHPVTGQVMYQAQNVYVVHSEGVLIVYKYAEANLTSGELARVTGSCVVETMPTPPEKQ